MGLPMIRSWRVNRGRTTTLDQARQIADQFQVFMDQLHDVSGKTIVEVGPGDAAALGALFLKHGASRYVVYDRFPGDLFGEHSNALYAALECAGFEKQITVRGAIEDATLSPEADIVISFDAL